MAIPADFRYLCTMKGRTLYVHGVASVDSLYRIRLPYKWTYAITESYMNKLVDDKKFDVVWYQEEFDFDS